MRRRPLTPAEGAEIQLATELAAEQERMGNRRLAQKCRDARWRIFDGEPRLNQSHPDNWLDEHIAWNASTRRERRQ